MAPAVKNIFVLMLENRSFDHMLGFSALTGTDAQTGEPTAVRGLSGSEDNNYGGQAFRVNQQVSDPMPVDPGHEFLDVLEQLCGGEALYASGGTYPPITNAGFVSDYAQSPKDEGDASGEFGQIMAGFGPGQLPVLQALAGSFAVCDGWHASMPGPTWPNRLFALAASSDGLDHSPTADEIIAWETIDGVSLVNGSIFDALKGKSAAGWRIYAGDDFPMAAALKGVEVLEIRAFSEFVADVARPDYPVLFTWIEPNYGDVLGNTFQGGTSQHPRDTVGGGEGLIKATYEAIRQSPLWESSLLIVTWDEHGGFFDHVSPPAAAAPGDTTPGSKYNQYGFTFEQLGVRVPAIVVSAFIPPNLIDHRSYDHSCIPATIQAAFDLPPLTQRDRAARSLLPLCSLERARTDAPNALPSASAPAARAVAQQPPSPQASVDSGSLPVFLQIAMRHDLALSPPGSRPAILARVKAIRTRAQAAQYMAQVSAKLRAARAAGAR
ncbi:MAG TPA: alkaline phosphatase family protein [Steroidobacteraceae bacterium]|jgi:phospholipase C|nr:alkaline phosphatase family protein [Steroidobacteraceae bacterium]